jgi:proteasome lid subunit RPN8/RPN11
MSRIPPTLRRYVVRPETIDRTRDFLAERGERGYEATVLWLGRITDESTAEIVCPYAPEQVAYRSEDGVAVEVTAKGLSALISALPDGVFVLCRVHTHPGDAYHSDTDDQNLIIAHPGAISIVVPDFARSPIALTRCSVNELGPDGRWRELSTDEIGERFEVEW